jgi:hypothetical protein
VTKDVGRNLDEVKHEIISLRDNLSKLNTETIQTISIVKENILKLPCAEHKTIGVQVKFIWVILGGVITGLVFKGITAWANNGGH